MVVEISSSKQPADPVIRVGIDIGGTFTDFVVFNPETGEVSAFKLLTTPHDPAEAVLAGLKQIRDAVSADKEPAGSQAASGMHRLQVVHGSTVATNALLERKGARTALITTRGFRDVLQIGRQNRRSLYDLSAQSPLPLIPADHCFEVAERVDHQGNILHPLDLEPLGELVSQLKTLAIESVAVSLLFSFLRPEHEQAIAKRLRDSGLSVSVSSEILPQYREYERTSTTAVNAYVSPVLERYLIRLEAALEDGGSRQMVMQSNGGVIRPEEARRNGVRCVLSGPAGGVVGAWYAARLHRAASPGPARQSPPVLNLITFDMGGTSTDVSLVSAAPLITTESMIGDCPIAIPVLDIHTIGAGGGSIASLDIGGALRVGPESAGADPGPACYARRPLQESRPTVTDANLVLGRLAPEYFLDGQLPLDPTYAWAVIERLGAKLGLSPIQAALGVVEVANAHMERALRVISVERGYDPYDFTLLSFGGAGGLHAADLARRMGIPQILIPPLASTLSAFGMLAADIIKDYAQTVMLDGAVSADRIETGFNTLVERARQEVQAEGVRPEQIVIERSLDMRYLGQSYELNVPWEPGVGDFKSLFHTSHSQAYGYTREDAQLEIVNLRVRATGKVIPPALENYSPAGPDPTPALLEHRQAVPVGQSDGRLAQTIEIPFYRGEALQPGNRIGGPAAVVRADTTLLLGPKDQAEVDPYLNLLIWVQSSTRES